MQNLETLTGHFTFLDNLRESGRVNMFGAVQVLMDELGMPYKEARTVWALWAHTFDESKTPEERAQEALGD